MYHPLYLYHKQTENKMKKTIITIAATIATVAFASCGKELAEVEPVVPQELTVKAWGQNEPQVVVNDPTQTEDQFPFLTKGYRTLNTESGYAEFSRMVAPGDSISVLVIDGSYMGHVYPARVQVTVGNEVIFNGETGESGILSVRGVLGADVFVEFAK